ncbi:MAG: lectin like domain-containing protein [Oscillospiraceae bacterium]|nr:lectin like domain-containing protein [Oscillospiraceae bacterium]
MLKRLTALVLTFVLIAPTGFIGGASALTTPNYIPETVQFIQQGNVPVSVAAAKEPSQGTLEAFLQFNGVMQTSDKDDAWAHAAYAAMNVAGNTELNYQFNDIPTASVGNRGVLTAFLMRSFSLRGNDPVMNPVKGIAYIPDMPSNAGPESVAKQVYNSRIKAAVEANSAVVASLYFDENLLVKIEDVDGTWIYVYDNDSRVTGSTISRRAANSSSVIVGWDDNIEFEYRYEKTPASGDNPAVYEDVTVKGAFLAYDSLPASLGGAGGGAYWISYATILSGAYYVEGFYDHKATFNLNNQLEDDKGVAIKKNPFAVTYEYDAAGLNNVRTISGDTVFYANVFTVKDGAAAIHAVSVFLTGEGNGYRIWFIDDYKETKDLNVLDSANTKKALVTSAPVGYKALPGYYTIPVIDPATNEAPIASEKQFAIVVEATGTGVNGPVLQNAAGASRGQSFTSSNATTWNDAFLTNQSAVCIKAHAEKDVYIPLTGVEVRDSDGDPLTVLEVVPNTRHTITPTLIPTNATNVRHEETVWEAQMPYYLRDDEGYLILDNDEKPTLADAPTGADWLVWMNGWGFVPKAFSELTTLPTGTTATTRQRQGKKEDSPDVINNIVIQDQPFTLSISNNGTTALQAPRSAIEYDGKDFPVQVTVNEVPRDATGTWDEDKGNFKPQRADFTVKIKATAVEKVTLSRTAAQTMKVGATLSFTATQLDADDKQLSAPHPVTWHIVMPLSGGSTDDYHDGYEKSPAFEPLDPFGGPVATVDKNGRVTALRSGVCFVYAEAGGKASDLTQITATGKTVTGVAIGRKKLIMAADTTFTMTGAVKPNDANDRSITWSSSNDAIATVEPATGIIRAISPGTVTISVSSKTSPNFKADCAVTVIAGPSATIRVNRAATYSVFGAKAGETIEWTFEDRDGNDSDNLRGEKINNGNKFRVIADDEGGAVLRAEVYVDPPEGDRVLVREQKWHLEGVVPIGRMAFQNSAGEDLKRVNLGIKLDGTSPKSQTLTAAVIKPVDGTSTLLGFEWSAKQTKQKQDIITLDPGTGDANNTVTITAARPGSTRLTGLNYNGNKRVNLSVRVFFYPETANITPKAGSLTMNVGKTGSATAKVTAPNAKDFFKTLTYTLKGADGEPMTTEGREFVENSFVRVDVKRGRVTALGPGEATVVIVAQGGATKEVPVTVKTKD